MRACSENLTEEEGRRGKEECGGTRFLQKAGFPRAPSGKNSYMANGTTDAAEGPAERWIGADLRVGPAVGRTGI
jgi:hypothetical protein